MPKLKPVIKRIVPNVKGFNLIGSQHSKVPEYLRANPHRHIPFGEPLPTRAKAAAGAFAAALLGFLLWVLYRAFG